MPIPWDDQVTATIDGPHGREVIMQDALRIVVPILARKGGSERNRILLAFADRGSPPFRYDGSQLGQLLVALDRQLAIKRITSRRGRGID